MTTARFLIFAALTASCVATALPTSPLVAAPQIEMGGGGRGPMPPRPAPPPGYAYQWVAPTYQTVIDQVWVPERTQMVMTLVEVAPGRWEQVLQPVVTPAHFESVTRRVLVAQGYWQLVRIAVVPDPIPLPRPIPIVRGPGTVGVEGYGSGPGEDLSKFSPLTEWPK